MTNEVVTIVDTGTVNKVAGTDLALQKLDADYP